jgi:DNA-binding MarR family transcriptional regulator
VPYTFAKDSTGFQFFNAVAVIEQLSRAALERRLPEGLRVSHFGVLNHCVVKGDGKTPLELARAFQVTKGAMTNTLGRLRERGYVELAPHPRDGRSKLVLLTEAGLRARHDAVRSLEPLMEELHGMIPREEFAAALPFLLKVAAVLDGNRECCGQAGAEDPLTVR